MKTFLILLLLTAVSLISSCATGPHAATDTAVGALGGAVVGGPVGAVVGGTAGNAYGREDDKH